MVVQVTRYLGSCTCTHKHTHADTFESSDELSTLATVEKSFLTAPMLPFPPRDAWSTVIVSRMGVPVAGGILPMASHSPLPRFVWLLPQSAGLLHSQKPQNVALSVFPWFSPLQVTALRHTCSFPVAQMALHIINFSSPTAGCPLGEEVQSLIIS